MSLFTWDSIYSVGVDLIDQQHKNLFAIANRFHDAYTTRQEHALLVATFGELLDYTVTHFADEERMLREFNYPDFARHKVNHEKLIALVQGYQQRLERAESGIGLAAMNFIQTWLNGHVLGMDRAYASHCVKPRT